MRFVILYFGLASLVFSSASVAEEVQIDASDPTKVYSYAGVGIKYTDYTNDESLTELRATGNIGITESDMVMFEVGFGKNSADELSGSSTDFTNGRMRWFHLFPMDYSVTSGYRGWGTQVDLQIAGSLEGTDGQNALAVGGLPAFGINENWSFYLPLNAVSSWDKKFERHNGFGASVAPLLVYAPDDWWDGAFLQFWPNYTYFVSGDLKNTGAGNFDITTGGEITPTVLWGATLQKNLDEDLLSYRRGRDTGFTNDWNAFFNVTTYF